jgi:foldase protein PrsA
MPTVAAIVILALSGCGSGHSAVARVGEQTISQETLEHWIPIEAAIDHGTLPQAPLPKGEVPDPPRYSACIQYLANKARTAPSHPPVPARSALKQQCRSRYDGVRRHMLAILVTFAWLKAETDALGLHVSEPEAAKEFTRYRKEVFKTDAAFRSYLTYTGETLADELLISKMDLLSTKLDKKIVDDRGLNGARRYFRDFSKRWAAKTDCEPGYVIPNCKQYKGASPPEAVL